MHGLCVTGCWQKQGICTEGHGVYTHTPEKKQQPVNTVFLIYKN